MKELKWKPGTVEGNEEGIIPRCINGKSLRIDPVRFQNTTAVAS